MTRYLGSVAILALVGTTAACTLNAEVAEDEAAGGAGGAVGGNPSEGGAATGGAATGGSATGGGATVDPVELVSRLYPNCSDFISETNPQVKNGIVQFDCGQSVDGPLYYLDLATEEVISTCGGACMAPDEAQLKSCVMMCPPPAYGDCYAAQGSTANVPACTATSLCLASQVGVRSVDGRWECFGINGSDVCQATDVQQFQYEDDDVRVQLNFNASIVGNYSTETLQAALTYWSVELKLPALTQPVPGQPGTVADFENRWSGDSVADFDTFEYHDGNLEVSFRYEVESVWFTTESDHHDCISDDIAGWCSCNYAPSTTARIWLDLPLQQ